MGYSKKEALAMPGLQRIRDKKKKKPSGAPKPLKRLPDKTKSKGPGIKGPQPGGPGYVAKKPGARKPVTRPTPRGTRGR